MSNVKIFLDAGHGGKDSGAVSGDRQEKDDVLRLVKAIGAKLSREYSNVVIGYSRTTDIYETPAKKAQDANTFGADFCFSFHRNCYNGRAEGWETEYRSHSNIKDAIMNDLNKAMYKIGFVVRGDKQRNNLAILNQTKAPALLFEVGFVDNSADNNIFDKKFSQIVDAFVDTISSRCGLEKIPGKMDNPKEKDVAAKCFKPNRQAKSMADFLHRKGYGAGRPNLAKIAAANCMAPEVKAALFVLGQAGELIKPDGLNKRTE